MRLMNDANRYFLRLEIRIHDLLETLHRHGYLTSERLGLPPDAFDDSLGPLRVVAVTPSPYSDVAGQAVQVVLEGSGLLPAECRFRGCTPAITVDLRPVVATTG